MLRNVVFDVVLVACQLASWLASSQVITGLSITTPVATTAPFSLRVSLPLNLGAPLWMRDRENKFFKERKEGREREAKIFHSLGEAIKWRIEQHKLKAREESLCAKLGRRIKPKKRELLLFYTASHC